MITYQSARADSLNYFNGEELPADTFLSKYALRDLSDELVESNPDQMHWRLAREFARVEAKKFKGPYSAEFIYSLFKGFGEIIPQGSPMYAVGNPRAVSSSNCYLAHSPSDSYGGIHLVDEELTQISKRRGGIGIDLSNIRPAGSLTSNSSRSTTGVPAYAERYSNSIREVGQEGRRGALMLSLSVHHPDVVAFCTMKMDTTKVTGANVSVRLSDEFLKAVDADAEYEQRWPVVGEAKVRKMVRARDVWRVIMQCAHARAEPGILFWDAIIRESPADCYSALGFGTEGTNPCGEIPLCPLDSCRLLLLNLFSFVRNPFLPTAFFDFNEFRRKSKIAQRLMDDLIDLELEKIDQILAKIESDPEPMDVKSRELNLWKEIREKCELGRRTGTGITALADAMAAVGIRYGSDESVQFTEQVYRTLKLGCYESSVDMAEELGPFPIWDASLESECPFLLRIRDEDPNLYSRMQLVGRRNIALLTTAPAGTTSLVAGPGPYFGTSSGIEPVFMMDHIRRKKINAGDTTSRVDFTDQSGDRWQNYRVYHPKLKAWMDATGETEAEKSPYHGACARDLDWRFRVRLQAAANRNIDHSISATVNIPESATVEDVATIYEEAWRSGCKGMTVYRENCRSGVLIDAKDIDKKVGPEDANKRPRTLPGAVHHVKVKGVDYCVVVGLMDGLPYEVFAGKSAELGVPRSFKSGQIVKVGRGSYRLVGEDKVSVCDSLTEAITDEEDALTRLASTSLRHHVPVQYLVHQFEKARGSMVGFAKCLARVLKTYIPDGAKVTGESCPGCGGSSLRRQEGCVSCPDCSWSKCS